MRYDFTMVQVKGKRVWKDADGKRREETKVFHQTINPFNRNADGNIKTQEEIIREITIQRDRWMAQSDETIKEAE